MRYAVAPVALAALAAAAPAPQGVTSAISPSSSPASGCQTSYSGTFNIQIVNVTDAKVKRSVHKRQSNILALSLNDGVLTDSQGRTGYIAANSQFQFDSPPQTGAIYTAGWSVCPNGYLTLGDDDRFFSCLSGNFYNLYDENVLSADQCTPVYINVVGSGSGAASVMSDGQPTGSAVSVMPDGQPTGSAVSNPVSQQADGQPTGTAVAPVTQISDGQVQATSAVASPVTQISDGQIQAPTSAAAVSQISDGQIQAPTSAAAVTQISDGQVQAPTSAVSPVSQISDGQIQAPTGSGYMPAANSTMVYPSVPVQTGNTASGLQISGMGLFAALFGAALL